MNPACSEIAIGVSAGTALPRISGSVSDSDGCHHPRKWFVA